MPLSVRVQGGTGAGKRRPLLPQSREEWECGCPAGRPLGRAGESVEAQLRKRNPRFLVRCNGCGMTRPAANVVG